MGAVCTGFVDLCLQSHVVGWAMEDGDPATLLIQINGALVAEVPCNLTRPELAAYNVPVASGFIHHFAKPLALSDEVSVSFRNGVQLDGSPSRQHLPHLSQMLHGITGGAGLELGALDRPLVSKDRYDVSFVDHADRAGLTAKYEHNADISYVDPRRMVGVDHVWAGGSLDRAVAGRRFDWALASGVIEHVGDPIGWLAEIAAVLRPHGRINLGIPDKSLTFDHARRLTTPAELIEDYHRRLQRPSFRHIFDHVAGASIAGAPAPDRAAQADRFRNAFAVASRAEQLDLYVDVHCHVWTRASWLECWDAIAALDLLPLKLHKAFEPLHENGQFVVSLIKA